MDLQSYQFPADALVHVKAWRRHAVEYWQFGTVGAMQVPAERQRRLRRVPISAQFKVVVVAGDDSGKLLGASSPLRPKLPRESLIPLTESSDLKQEVWRIEFAEGEPPELLVNSRISGISELVRTDPGFRALVMPQVLRSVLSHILFVERAGLDDDSDGWHMGWLRLAQTLISEAVPPLTGPEDDDAREAALQWIEDVVGAFAADKVQAADSYAQSQVSL